MRSFGFCFGIVWCWRSTSCFRLLASLPYMSIVVRRVVVLGIARNRLNIRFGHCTSCLFDNSSVKLCKHDTPLLFAPSGANMSRVWGGTAFAKRSGAMKAPVGLLSGSAVCDSRWRGVAPTSATPTRSLRKCRRIAEVKSQWSTTFSRIENLWPRDGSCPLPLRSKRIFNIRFYL